MLAKHKHSFIYDISIFAIIFLAFYLLWLGSYPLFSPDEARYSGAARDMLLTGNTITPKVNGIPFLDKPILYYWLQAISMRALGVNEWAIRLFPVLIALWGCIITYISGRMLFDRKTGLIAATILATTPLYFGGAHYANLDLEVAVWISSALLCTISAIQIERERRSFMLAAYFFTGLAILTKGLIGILFPVMITGLWLLITGRWNVLKKLHVILGIGMIAVITAPWFLAVQSDNPDFLHYFFVTQQFSRFVSAGVYNNKTVIWFYLPIIIVGFFPWVLFLPAAMTNACRAYWGNKQEYGAELFLLLWVTIVLVFFSLPQSKLIGYILPILPALALLTGRNIALTWNRDRQSIVYFALAFGFLCVGLGLTLAVLPQYLQNELLLNTKYVLFAIANLLIAGGILLIATLRYINIPKLTFFCATLSLIILLIIVANANKLNTNSTKRLVQILQTTVQPTDAIYNYYKFYQDVPLYLGRKVQLIADWNAPDIITRDNWIREMWLGRNTPNAAQILVSEAKFWEQWHSNVRVFVFLNENYLAQFKQHAKYYQVIGHQNDIYLLCNQIPRLVKRYEDTQGLAT